jgi:hypothetical protein
MDFIIYVNMSTVKFYKCDSQVMPGTILEYGTKWGNGYPAAEKVPDAMI